MPVLEPPGGISTPGTPGSLVPSGGTAMPGDPGHLTPSTPTPPPSPPPANQPVTPSPAPVAPPTNLPQTPISPEPGFVPSSKADTNAGNVGLFAAEWRTGIGAEARISTAANKTSLADADAFPLIDSAASSATKKITWANFKAALGSLFVGLTGNQTKAGVLTLTSVPKSTANSALSDVTDLLNLQSVLNLMGDPRFVMFRDDFENGAKWNLLVSGSASGGVDGYNGSNTGCFDLQTGATSGSIAGQSTFAYSNLNPIFMTPWVYLGRFKVSSLTSVKVRLGFSANNNGGDPNLWNASFLGFDFQPALSPNWRFASGLPGGPYTYQDSGIPVVAGQYYKFRIRSTGGENSAYWSIDGGPETLLAAPAANDYYTGLAHSIANTAAANKVLFCDFVSFTATTTR